MMRMNSGYAEGKLNVKEISAMPGVKLTMDTGDNWGEGKGIVK